MAELSALRIWDYFLEDSLGVGVPWDLELILSQDRTEEDTQDITKDHKKKETRRVVSAA